MRKDVTHSIHSKLNYEKIILGICLYVLRSNGYLIPYRHDFVRKSKLNKMQYNVIKPNINRLQVL